MCFVFGRLLLSLCHIWQPNYSHFVASKYLNEVATYNYVHISDNNAMSNTTQVPEGVNTAACTQAKIHISSSLLDKLSTLSIPRHMLCPGWFFAIFSKASTSFPAGNCPPLQRHCRLVSAFSLIWLIKI